MRNIIFCILLVCTIPLHSQRHCGSQMNLSELQQTDHERYQRIMSLENITETNLRGSDKSIPSGTIIIPVVVHIVYNNNTQNISDAQINAQIQVLNQDYKRLNLDKTNTPNAFMNVAGTANFEFRLAKIAPNGDTTSGITRTQTTISAFSQENNVKFSNTGGCDAWDTERYLNIWVCNLSLGLMGYAQFPSDFQVSPNTDGVVVSYKYFGVGDHTESPYNKGRTATHEVGHWLNLRHIWGDAHNCSATDFVDDTPNQYQATYSYPTFPKTDNCTSSSPGIMFMNYMDYTDDAGMNMFTVGQVARMRSLFDSATGIRRKMMQTAEQLTNPFAISGNSYLCISGTFNIENLPTNATVQWSTKNGNFNITPAENGAVSVQANNYNASDSLIANISYNGTPSLTLRKYIYSCSFNIYGNDRSVSCTPHRFSAPLIAGTSVVWQYSSPIVAVEQQDDYIDITVEGTTASNLWLKATIINNATGNEIATETISLPNHNLKGITMTNLGSWQTQINGVWHKQYGFRIDTNPTGISFNDLCFAWSNKDITNSGGNTGSGGMTIVNPFGSATIQTGGGTGPLGCLTPPVILPPVILPPDSFIVIFPRPFSRNEESEIQSLLPHPYVPTDEANYALVTLPASSYEGTITGTVKSDCGASYSQTHNINNSPIIIYHVQSNPASNGILTLRQEDGLGIINTAENITITLYSTSSPVRSKTVSLAEMVTQIDTSGLPNGNYVLTISKNNQITQSQIVIIKN